MSGTSPAGGGQRNYEYELYTLRPNDQIQAIYKVEVVLLPIKLTGDCYMTLQGRGGVFATL